MITAFLKTHNDIFMLGYYTESLDLVNITRMIKDNIITFSEITIYNKNAINSGEDIVIDRNDDWLTGKVVDLVDNHYTVRIL
jgi:hypothetical protein